MREQLDKIARYRRENNLSKTVGWIVVKVIRNVLQTVIDFRVTLFMKKTNINSCPTIKTDFDFQYRVVDSIDNSSFENIYRKTPKNLSVFRERQKRGQTCLACYKCDSVVGYIWISFISETDREHGITLTPDPEESYGFDLYVLPEYRKKAVGFKLINEWILHARSQGRTTCTGFVDRFNKPMLMTMKMIFGFQPIRKHYIVRIFKRYGFVLSTTPIADPKQY